MPELTFGQAQVVYEVVHSRRATIGIEVRPDRQVVVRVPYSVDDEHITSIVRQKTPWILRQLARVQLASVHHIEKEFVSGESFSYLGKNYRLKIIGNGVDASTSVAFHSGRLWVITNRMHDIQDIRMGIRNAIVAWYQKRARDVLTRHVEVLSRKTGIKPFRVNVKSQLHRWGSCTKNRVLNLNWRIIMAPTSIIDYVITHELCHLKIHNHSTDFWQFLGAILPDYKKRREWLRNNGQLLDF